MSGDGSGLFNSEQATGILLIGVIIAALGLGVQLCYSRVCAIVVLSLAVGDTILALAMYGKFEGWYLIIGGIIAVVYTFRIQKAYTDYSTTGRYPGIA